MRFSLFYLFLGLWIKAGMLVYFRRYHVTGKKRYPFKEPVILAPNHQSAFMDALVVAGPLVQRTQVSFMVRQDVFKNKFAAFMLRHMRLFPAYRMRDGYENLSKNQESFEHCYNLLKHNYDIIVFPEANHDVPRKIRALKKGLMRIAFEGVVNNGVSAKLKIVPVGVTYSDPFNMGGQALMNYGEPMTLEPYLDLYRDNPAKAINKLRKDLKERMQPLTIDITNDEYHDEIELVRDIIVNTQSAGHEDYKKGFAKHKTAIATIEDWIDANPANNLKEFSRKYRNAETKSGIKDKLLVAPSNPVKTLFDILAITVTLPLFVLAAIIHYYPFAFPNNLADSKVKDLGFRSSIKFGLGLVLTSVLYIILTVVSAFILPKWWMCLFVLIGLYLLGILYARWIRHYRKLKAKLKYRALMKREDPSIIEQHAIRKQILGLFDIK